MSSQAQTGSGCMPECWCICVPDQGGPRPRPHVCIPLPPDYSMRHIGQFFRSNYVFLFQLPWLPEKLLSMSDFQVKENEGLGRLRVEGDWLGRWRSIEARVLLCSQILKTTLTHRKRGIPRLSPNELEAFLYDFSQPGGLTGPLNYYRNIFR